VTVQIIGNTIMKIAPPNILAKHHLAFNYPPFYNTTTNVQ